MLAPARSARGPSFESRDAVAVGREDLRAGRGRRQRQRLAPGPGAKIDDCASAPGRAGKRDQLAAFVLDLDEPVRELRMIVDPACRAAGGCPRD